MYKSNRMLKNSGTCFTSSKTIKYHQIKDKQYQTGRSTAITTGHIQLKISTLSSDSEKLENIIVSNNSRIEIGVNQSRRTFLSRRYKDI